jgi:NADPH:quinone reductase
MKAARVHRFGEPLSFDEVDEPEAGPGEVVVEVEVADVNPLDIWVTRGTVAGGWQPLPFVPGTEATVRLEGQRYIAAPPGAGTLVDGFYRERAAVPRSALVPLPEGVDPVQAAALGIVGITAWRLVHDVTGVGSEDRALVLGASGGVGTMLLQLLRAQGATVWGQTGSADKAEAVTSMGADRAVVAGAAELPAAVAELQPTVAFDPLGGPFTAALVEALQPLGRLVLFGTSAGPEQLMDLRALYRKGLTLRGFGGMVEPAEKQAAAFAEVLRELAAGRLRVPVAEVLPLERAAEAHQRILDRRVTGKLVLRP